MTTSEERTVLVAVQLGFATRYLLQTEVLARLLELGNRVVILSPNAEDPTFRADYARPGVHFELFDYEAIDQRRRSRIYRYFLVTRQFTLPAGLDRDTVLSKMSALRATYKRRPVLSRLIPFIALWTARLLSRSERLRALFRAVEARLLSADLHAGVFEKWKPDALVLIDLGTLEPSNFIMREARERSVPIISIILSWDNLTSKGIGGVVPDYAVAWNANMAEELRQYHGLDKEKIHVAGIAHFDRYYREGFPLPRTAICQRLRVSTASRLVVFGTGSPSLFRENERVVKVLCRAIREERFPDSTRLVVRVHPAYEMRGSEDSLGELGRLRDFCAANSDVVCLDVPVLTARRVGWDFPIAEVDFVGSLLSHAAALVTQFSTLMLEAAILDCPVVNVGFDRFRDFAGASGDVVPQRTHLKRVLRTGFAPLARSEEELVEHVQAYLQDPARDRAARQFVASEEAGPNRGRAGVAVADFVSRLVGGVEHTV